MHRITTNWMGILAVATALTLSTHTALAQSSVVVFDDDTDITLASDVEIGNDFTIEYWFRTLDAVQWQLLNNDATDKINFQHRDESTIQMWWWPNAHFPLDESFATNAWEHFALTRSNFTIKVYRNGTEVGERYSNHPMGFDRIGGVSAYSGHGSIPPGTNYHGRATDLRVWNYARTQAEIAAEKDQRLRGTEDGLLAYYRLDDGFSNVVYNLATDSAHGTINTVQWDTVTGLSLTDPLADGVAFTRFTLADKTTGSTDFTGSNTVDITEFPVPADYDQYQITESSNVASVVPANFVSVTPAPAEVTFTEPGSSQEVFLYAWFTNSTADVPLRLAPANILYTTVTPTPSLNRPPTRVSARASRYASSAKSLRTARPEAASEGRTLESTAMKRISTAAGPTRRPTILTSRSTAPAATTSSFAS